MDFSLTEEQALIAESAADVLGEMAGHSNVECALAKPSGFDESLWQKLSQELGWCGLSIAEAHGGLGLGSVEMALVLEQAGKHLLVSPLLGTVGLAATLVCEVGTPEAQARFLPGIASGQTRLGIALPSQVNGWQVPDDEQRMLVLDADASGGVFLLHGNRDERGAWFHLPARAIKDSHKRIDGWDATRRLFQIRPESVAWDQARRIDDQDASSTDGRIRAASRARLHIAAEQLGSAQACLDMTVAYTLERKQFGRVVGGFQAVKHRCAEMMVRIESLRSQVLGAAATVDDPNASVEQLFMECAAARAMAIETTRFCAQEAIQLHGGVGFTWEFAPHWHFKRAQFSRSWLGSGEALHEAIAEQLFVGAFT